jgi:hypothetical protein
MLYIGHQGISLDTHLNLLAILLVHLALKIQIRDDKSTVIFLCKYEKNQ